MRLYPRTGIKIFPLLNDEDAEREPLRVIRLDQVPTGAQCTIGEPEHTWIHCYYAGPEQNASFQYVVSDPHSAVAVARVHLLVTPTPMTADRACLNGCTNGACSNAGECICLVGWFSADCSNRLVTFGSISRNVSEMGLAAAASFSVQLSMMPSSNVTCELAVEPVGAAELDQPTITFAPADWREKTVQVRGVRNLASDSDVFVVISTRQCSSADPRFNGDLFANVSVWNRNVRFPVIHSVTPAILAEVGGPVMVLGSNFVYGSSVLVRNESVDFTWVSDAELHFDLDACLRNEYRLVTIRTPEGASSGMPTATELAVVNGTIAEIFCSSDCGGRYGFVGEGVVCRRCDAAQGEECPGGSRCSRLFFHAACCCLRRLVVV